MDSIISAVIMFAVVISAISLTVIIGKPLIDDSISFTERGDTRALFRIIDNYVEDVYNEGYGSKRIFEFRNDINEIEVTEDENVIITEVGGSFPEGRVIDGNLVEIVGNNAECNSEENITMENEFIKITFRKTNETVNTTDLIMNMTNKVEDLTIWPSDTSVLINEDYSSSYGQGYTRLLGEGNNRPFCKLEVFVNSSFSYYLYYTLYSGADFVVTDVKNIEKND